jgi:hypothetical protein
MGCCLTYHLAVTEPVSLHLSIKFWIVRLIGIDKFMYLPVNTVRIPLNSVVFTYSSVLATLSGV